MPGKPEEKNNATAYPSFYYAKHMATGLAGYENETILVDGDAIKNMIPTFVGKPVVVLHQDIELKNLETKDGTVIESFYNEVDGGFWTKMLIETDAARNAIAQGWGVSNCYQPTEWAGSGTHHNLSYDRQIVNGVFKHLAIVPNPRYEEAKIYSPEEFKLYQEEKRAKLVQLKNAKEQKKMFKLFKNTRQEVKEIDEDTFLEIDGKDISLKEIINAVSKAEADKKKADEKKNNLDAKIKVGDQEMSVGDLVNKYNAMKKKKNEDDDEDEEDKENEDEGDKDCADEKKNAEDLKNAQDAAEKAKKEAEEKAANFEKLMNAANKQETYRSADLIIESSADKLARGKTQYGSGK